MTNQWGYKDIAHCIISDIQTKKQKLRWDREVEEIRKKDITQNSIDTNDRSSTGEGYV